MAVSGRGAALDHGGHVVEVAGAHFLLVRHEGVAFGGRAQPVDGGRL